MCGIVGTAGDWPADLLSRDLLFLIPVLPPLALVLAFMFYFAGASVFA